MTQTLVYTMSNGAQISGDLQQISDICSQMGEQLEVSKLQGFDTSEYYYSKSKGKFMLIKDMATPHLMHSITKTIRDYFKQLKVPNDTSVADFTKLLREWSDNPKVKRLLDELADRK